MTYVFDTNCFIVMGHYYPEQFPSFWEKFNQAVEVGKIISVREVLRELDRNAAEDHLVKWIKLHKHIFLTPNPAVMQLVNEIFSVPHFQASLPNRTQLGKNPFADPFVIAQAKIMNCCVITQESENQMLQKFQTFASILMRTGQTCKDSWKEKVGASNFSLENLRKLTMKYDNVNRTFDCEPTLTDTQVLQYCRDGYLQLQGVVPDEINQRTCDYLNGDLPINPCFIPQGITHADLERMRDTHEPSSILLEDWYIEHVLLNRELAGALRSLLGKNVGLPVLVSNHRVECPMPAQGWHHDADHVFGPETNFVEVFYFPQDTPLEMGPTELMPGSHIRSTSRDIAEKGVSSEGPAGSFVIHSQSILHRRGESTAEGLRHMLKYSYWRTVPPTQDWKEEPEFDLQTAEYGGHGVARYVAHMFYWLCGKGDEFRLIGGQAWPWSSVNQIGPSYGFGHTEGYLPNWRKNNPDDYATP